MNRLFCTSALLIIVPALALAQGVTLSDHSAITVLSDFRIQDPVELRTEKDISAEVRYRTLNHEGGTRFRVLEIVERSDHGMWLYVLLTAPTWTDSGEWIKRGERFLIFVAASQNIYGYGE